jgi:hypothetical protein
MPNAPTQSYHTAPLFYKILAWLTLVALGFVAFHFVMEELMDKLAANWVREIYMTLLFGLPFFLFLAGSTIRDRIARPLVLLALAGLFAGYAIKQLDFFDIADLPSTSTVIAISAGGLAVIYLVYFIFKMKRKWRENASGSRNELLLDLLKLSWLIAICTAFVGVHVQWGKFLHPLRALQVSIFIFPLLMAFGLYVFFRKPR